MCIIRSWIDRLLLDDNKLQATKVQNYRNTYIKVEKLVYTNQNEKENIKTNTNDRENFEKKNWIKKIKGNTFKYIDIEKLFQHL